MENRAVKNIALWIFLFSAIFCAIISADYFISSKHPVVSADAARYRLEKTGKYTQEQIEEYIKTRDLK